MLAAGGVGAVKQAKDIVNDCIQRFGMTVFLGELQASLNMRSGNYPEALQVLKQCRSLAIEEKRPSSRSALVNSIVCFEHLGDHAFKDQEFNKTRLVKELGAIDPDDPYFQMMQKIQEAF
uniref:Uncharacterized protein n=1 Tax=Spongospora subterranea TaxID=70186 RepID=A0A0H5QFK8_9EUKA|eukprot:CRZ00740.1 hypothetical protein [Spongospora subterranea]